MSTQDDLRELYERLLPGMKENCGKSGGLVPTVFILRGDKTMDIVGLSFVDYREKRTTFDRVDKLLEESQAVGLVFASEAWTATAKGKSFEEAKRARSAMTENLEHQPGRKEVLMVMLMAHGWSEGYSFEIKRAGKKLSFGEPQMLPHSNMENNTFRYFQKWVS
jgi:hypothetical protein